MVALLLTMNTASAPKSAVARRGPAPRRSGVPGVVVSQITASGWAASTSSTSASPYVRPGIAGRPHQPGRHAVGEDLAEAGTDAAAGDDVDDPLVEDGDLRHRRGDGDAAHPHVRRRVVDEAAGPVAGPGDQQAVPGPAGRGDGGEGVPLAQRAEADADGRRVRRTPSSWTWTMATCADGRSTVIGTRRSRSQGQAMLVVRTRQHPDVPVRERSPRAPSAPPRPCTRQVDGQRPEQRQRRPAAPAVRLLEHVVRPSAHRRARHTVTDEQQDDENEAEHQRRPGDAAWVTDAGHERHAGEGAQPCGAGDRAAGVEATDVVHLGDAPSEPQRPRRRAPSGQPVEHVEHQPAGGSARRR